DLAARRAAVAGPEHDLGGDLRRAGHAGRRLDRRRRLVLAAGLDPRQRPPAPAARRADLLPARRRRGTVAVRGAPLGVLRGRGVRAVRLDQPRVGVRAGEPGADRGQVAGLAGTRARPGHPEDQDRLARGLDLDQGPGLRGRRRPRRAHRPARQAGAGRRDMGTPYDPAGSGPGLPPPPTAGAPGHGGPPPAPAGGSAPLRPPAPLSPRALLIDPLRTLRSLLLPLVGVLFVGGFSPRSFLWAAFGVVLTVIYTAVRWATFTYQVTEDRLELRRSLIGRSIRTIPLDRIRGVDISTPPLHRLLGLAVLRIDTGASGEEAQEGELNALTAADAERVRAVLIRRAAAAHAAAGRTAAPGAEPSGGTAPAPPAAAAPEEPA